jgi:hypothetical protein
MIVLYLFIITIIFLLYVELTVGNVIYRVVASGEKKLNIFNGLSFLIEPLKNSFLWNWKVLDLNYIVILSLSTIFYQNILTPTS